MRGEQWMFIFSKTFITVSYDISIDKLTKYGLGKLTKM